MKVFFEYLGINHISNGISNFRQYIKNRKNYCPVCESKGIIFNPLPKFFSENYIKYGFKYWANCELLSLDKYSCSNCGASDRERLYKIWIDCQIKNQTFKPRTKTIHFAPESALSAKLKSSNFFNYKTADIAMTHVDFFVDLMRIPFPDNSYDFFICSHVLEHVQDDQVALAELFRILRRGGVGILMVPIVIDLDEIFEDPSIKTDEDRWKYYGQYDHVRLYNSKGFVQRIVSAGFKVDKLDINFFSKKIFEEAGIPISACLYVVNKYD
jgi:SAM-dependent methyltransferase